MRILLVSNGFPPSGQWGTEFYTHQLATGLAARGHTVQVLCPRRDGEGERFEVTRTTRYGIRLVEVHNPPARRKRFADSYRCGAVEDLFEELVPEFQPDVVHFLHLFWGLSVRLPAIAKRFGARTMATLTDLGPACHRGQLLDAALSDCDGPSPAKCARCVRASGPYDGNVVKRRVKGAAAEALSALGGLGLVVTESDLRERDREVRAAIGNLDQIVTPTRALASRLVETGVLAEVPRVLCYGLDERPFRDAPARVPDGVFRIGFLGQFQPHKGLDTLFQAAARMSRTPMGEVDWELRLHGNPVGGRHRMYLNRTWDPSLARRVRFEGPFEPLDAPYAMSELDAIVVPSTWLENAPLVVLQARVMGVPIVATHVGGIQEVAPKSSRLVPPGDAPALARALTSLILEAPDRGASVPLPLGYTAHLETVERLYSGREALRYAVGS